MWWDIIKSSRNEIYKEFLSAVDEILAGKEVGPETVLEFAQEFLYDDSYDHRIKDFYIHWEWPGNELDEIGVVFYLDDYQKGPKSLTLELVRKKLGISPSGGLPKNPPGNRYDRIYGLQLGDDNSPASRHYDFIMGMFQQEYPEKYKEFTRLIRTYAGEMLNARPYSGEIQSDVKPLTMGQLRRNL